MADLIAQLAHCRGATLTPAERAQAAALWRKLRPIDPVAADAALRATQRRLGAALHLTVYLDALTAHLVRQRTTKGASSS